MGATFVKLGQVLSSRPDLLPPPYLEALSRLQDRVEPFSGDEAERIVEEELGVRLSQAFQRLEREPIAAASLGQVHRAALRDGREVAVKVQRPGLRDSVEDDLEALEDLAEAVDHHTEAGRRYAFGEMLEQFRGMLLQELDYRQEAANLLVERLPGRLNAILDALADDRFRVTVDAMDEELLTGSLKNIANRITAGLVLAALILGAALLMRVETPFTILGYPGLAMLFFLLAAGCGFVLGLSILFGDRRRRREGLEG